MKLRHGMTVCDICKRDRRFCQSCRAGHYGRVIREHKAFYDRNGRKSKRGKKE